jgi:AmiR/NasT family two-component response regulator
MRHGPGEAGAGISTDEAFEELSRESQNTNVKLREVAARLLDNARREGV